MNRHEIEGNWKQIKGQVKERWAKLTDDDLKQIEGRRDRLVGKVQERYGETQAAASAKVDDFLEKVKQRTSEN